MVWWYVHAPPVYLTSRLARSQRTPPPRQIWSTSSNSSTGHTTIQACYARYIVPYRRRWRLQCGSALRLHRLLIHYREGHVTFASWTPVFKLPYADVKDSASTIHPAQVLLSDVAANKLGAFVDTMRAFIMLAHNREVYLPPACVILHTTKH